MQRSEIVFATGNAVIAHDGGRIKVMKGTHWPASDPLVKQHSDLFSDDPRWGLFYSVEPAGYRDVEATPAPARSGRVTNRGN
jgi:hypothetical protein